MKILRKETILVPAAGAVITMTYILCEDADGSYAIALENRTTGEKRAIPNITSSLDKARDLFDRLVRGSVTTVTFRDVVEDALAAG